MQPISAQEWGRRQAAAAPTWTDEQWHRICASLRVDLPRPVALIQHYDQADEHDGPTALRRAA